MKYKILYSLALVFGIVLPVSIKLGNVVLGILLGIILMIILKKGKYQLQFDKRILFFSTIPFFLLLIQGLFITENLSQGFGLLGRYATYLLTPVLFCFLDKETVIKTKENAQKGLVVGVILASIILLTNNFIKYYSHKPLFTIDKDLFNYYHTYYNFTEILKIHPSYFGMYVLLATAISISYVFNDKNRIFRILYLLTIGVYSMVMVFLNARVVTVLFFVILIVFIFVVLKRIAFRNKIVFSVSILMILISTILFYNTVKNTYLLSRFTDELKWELTPNKNSIYNGKTSADSRIVRWNSSISVIQEKPVFGHGCAMEKQVLEKQFLKDQLYFSAKNQYDAHNQYLSFAIEFGLTGILCFLVFLFSNIYFSLKRKDYIALTLFVTLLSVSLFEDVFKNNAGIIFIALFSNLFLYVNRQDEINY
ncbi:MAG: O-antigen ligase family protein [Flavobacterium sp.]